MKTTVAQAHMALLKQAIVEHLRGKTVALSSRDIARQLGLEMDKKARNGKSAPQQMVHAILLDMEADGSATCTGKGKLFWSVK